MSETWTIGELAERAAALLGAEPPVNGRVREVPNERLIRWYATIGLLDPPLARRGRIALYGRRHLLQLVAVKRRQAEGLPLAAIQAELAGATDAMLQRVARLPEPLSSAGSHRPPAADPPSPGTPDFGGAPAFPGSPAPLDSPMPTGSPTPLGGAVPAADPPSPGSPAAMGTPDVGGDPGPHGSSPDDNTVAADGFPSGPDAPSPGAGTPDVSSRGRFWTRPTGPAPSAFARPANPARFDGIPPAPAATAPPDVVHGVRLAPGVTVLLDLPGRVPTAGDVAALRAAGEPLLAALATLGLSAPVPGRPARPDHSDHAEGMTP
ncbi:MerR family transcriptional regulator [Microbispora sp. ATCC PTA-5024]|uniref:MerR family transcriptional regulator n=1 Tax=Microbispora sp. ATCC PTA-5024 TaxID=316330 RepID=UPI0003DBC5EA|nr:MerR family transcriptional regulator [Microbispora sp. ATCC PTA-5024]ETK36240.1 hypothetical protein MPTA5024_09785 [Microbispora sp. ATCC PTA-5024]